MICESECLSDYLISQPDVASLTWSVDDGSHTTVPAKSLATETATGKQSSFHTFNHLPTDCYFEPTVTTDFQSPYTPSPRLH